MSAKSKADATARMYALAGEPVEALGPGSKEKRSAFEAFGRSLGLELGDVRTKVGCCRLLAERLGVEWDEACYSAGDTITLTGMNRLLGAVDQGEPSMPAHRSTNELDQSRSPNVDVDDSGVERQIAESIADLTRSSEAPSGFGPGVTEVEPDAVQFDDGSWRTHLASVAQWLYLADNLVDASEDAFDASLARGLGFDEGWDDDLHHPLQDRLFPALAVRLDRALALRAEFVTGMESAAEGSETRESATSKWVDAWQDVDEEEGAEGGGPIHAEADTWPINEFVGHASDDVLNLSPSYQRADVWPTSSSQVLIESILRGIPLPSIIILERGEDQRTSYEVVDGKQRLTSILRFIGHHPRAVELVKAKAEEWGVPDLLDLFQRNYPEFKKLWKKHEVVRLTAQVERLNYFPFPLRSDVKPLSGGLEALQGKYYGNIREVQIEVMGQSRPVRHLFEQVSKYKLPVITYKRVTSEQIHEVFSLYNKQGKHLNAEEIRNALYHHLVFMKALVVTAGDSGTVESDAPFLATLWADLKSSQDVLDSYGFGHAGYKRTKVLSWVASVLLLDDGSPERRSTANQINALLKRIETDKRDHLRDEATVLQAMHLLDKGLDAHASIPPDVWSKKFVNSQGGGKWQELQLVASLISLSAAHVVHGDDLPDLVEEKAQAITNASATWIRPAKTQSKEQWLYVARVVRGMLEILDVSVAAADTGLRERFGASGLATLVNMKQP